MTDERADFRFTVDLFWIFRGHCPVRIYICLVHSAVESLCLFEGEQDNFKRLQNQMKFSRVDSFRDKSDIVIQE